MDSPLVSPAQLCSDDLLDSRISILGIHNVLPLVFVIESDFWRDVEIPRLAGRLDAISIPFPPLESVMNARRNFNFQFSSPQLLRGVPARRVRLTF